MYPAGKKNKTYAVPDTVREIDNYAFYDCDLLEKVELTESVEFIGSYAFSQCSNLNNIVLPDSDVQLGNNAFDGCSELSEIKFSDCLIETGSNIVSGTPWLSAQPDGVVYLGSSLYCYKGIMPENTVLTIKSGTLSVASNAFNSYFYNDTEISESIQNDLVSVTLPDGMKFINSDAFRECIHGAGRRIHRPAKECCRRKQGRRC